MKARVVLSLLVPASMIFAYACGGGDDSAATDGGTDGTVGTDGSPSGDGSPGTDGGPGSDGSTNDSGAGDSGNAGDSGGTDGGGGLNLGCTAPSDCDAGFCCGTIVFNGGQLPHCDLADASSSCQPTCKSYVKLSCTATDTVRACAAKNDCLDAGSGYTSCCNVTFADASVEFCWSSQLANLVGGSCL